MRTGWVSLHPDPTDPILLTPLAAAAGRWPAHMVQVGDTILGTWPDEFLRRLADTIDAALSGAPSAEVEPGGIRRPPAPSAASSAGPAPGDTDATARGSSFGDSAPAPASGRPTRCISAVDLEGEVHGCILDVGHQGAHSCGSCPLTWIDWTPAVATVAAGDPAHLRGPAHADAHQGVPGDTAAEPGPATTPAPGPAATCPSRSSRDLGCQLPAGHDGPHEARTIGGTALAGPTTPTVTRWRA